TAEALKLLTNNKSSLRCTIASFDMWDNQFVEIDVQHFKKADCTSCGEHATYPYLQYDQQTKSAVLCARQAVQIRPPEKQHRNLKKSAEQLRQSNDKAELNEFSLSLSLEEERSVLATDARALIHGPTDTDKART